MNIIDTRDMNEFEVRSAYETSHIIRNALDDSTSLDELRVFINDLMNDYMGKCLQYYDYNKEIDPYINDGIEESSSEVSNEITILKEITALLKQATYENEILVDEINDLNRQIIAEGKY